MRSSIIVGCGPSQAQQAFDKGAEEFKKGYSDNAIAEYTRAIELDPRSAIAYNNRGLAYAKKNDLELAIADYTKSIELEPKASIAYYNRGSTYFKKGNLEKTIIDFSKAIELDPKMQMLITIGEVPIIPKGGLNLQLLISQ